MADPIANDGIVAQAFRYMKLPPISSLQDDTEEAGAALAQYPVALEYCLELNDWSFGSKLADLSEATGGISDPDLTYVYKLPNDCVLLFEVQPIGSIKWRLDDDFLRTDTAGPIRIRYIKSISNESKLSSTFKTLVAYRLAIDLGPRFGISNTREDRLEGKFDKALVVAKRADRKTASLRRYDGREDDLDWVTEATR